MDANLKKYLSDVFRNEIHGGDDQVMKESKAQAGEHLIDRNINQFILDKRYSLRLDEIA